MDSPTEENKPSEAVYAQYHTEKKTITEPTELDRAAHVTQQNNSDSSPKVSCKQLSESIFKH